MIQDLALVPVLKAAELEMEGPPFLYYGTKKELAEQKIKPVAI